MLPPARVRAESQTAGCPAGHFSKSPRSGAPPVVLVTVENKPALYFPPSCSPPARLRKKLRETPRQTRAPAPTLTRSRITAPKSPATQTTGTLLAVGTRARLWLLA